MPATPNPDLRLDALRASGLLNADVDPIFDRMTRLAIAALRVPVALISLVDENRQFFVSQCGLPEPWASARETPLSHSFCQHVASNAEPLIIGDARAHPLVRDNLAVVDLGVVAYAGVPVIGANGFVLGSLCAIDVKPRDWTDEDVAVLKALSAQFSSEFQLRILSASIAGDLDRQRELFADHRTMLRLNVHDLRTPLTAMLLGMDALEHLGPLNADQQEYLALTQRNAQSLLGIVNKLLEFAVVEQRGKEALANVRCDPAKVLKRAREQVQSLAAEKLIGLQFHYPPSLPQVVIEADQLLRVLVNLLANAIKFTHGGGDVRLGVTLIHDAAGKSIQFAVEDTGIGMEDGARIFEEGVKLDPDASTERSAGLGLTFCKRVVEAHGGQIWFESQFGVGSTFYVALPTAD